MELLTTKEAAAVLKVSTNTLYRLFNNGKLERTQVGNQLRVTRQALEQYISRNTKQTARAEA